MGKLRLLLALSVVATHGGVIGNFYLVDGPVAVQAFFIISGFYMSFILNEKYVGIHNSYKLFLRNRFLRLFPTYWLVLIATFIMIIFIIIIKNDGSLSIFQFFKDAQPDFLTWFMLIFTNISVIGQDWLLFTGIDNHGALYLTSQTPPVPMTAFHLVPQAWTISMEIFFYLIAPFLLRKNWRLIAILMFFSLLIRTFLFYGKGYQNDPWTYRFFPSEIFFFLSGYFSYKIFVALRKNRDKWISFPTPVSAILITAVIVYSFIPDFQVIPSVFSIKQVIFLFFVFFSIPFLFLKQKDQPIDRLLGELSYPVYIVHIAVILAVSGLGLFRQFPWLVVPISILVSYVILKLLMEPLEKKRQHPFKFLK